MIQTPEMIAVICVLKTGKAEVGTCKDMVAIPIVDEADCSQASDSGLHSKQKLANVL